MLVRSLDVLIILKFRNGTSSISYLRKDTTLKGTPPETPSSIGLSRPLEGSFSRGQEPRRRLRDSTLVYDGHIEISGCVSLNLRNSVLARTIRRQDAVVFTWNGVVDVGTAETEYQRGR